jgi:hypothetical protein
VCEAKLLPGPSNREVCRRSECRAELRKFPQTYRWPKTGERPPRSAHSTGLKTGTKSGRAWCKVAGPDLPEINLQTPDAGLVARQKKRHATSEAAWRKAAWHAKRRALIKRHHPPVNIGGGYKFPDAPAVDLSPIESAQQWAPSSNWKPAGAGADVPDIPEFLRREVSVASRPVADEADLMPEAGLHRKVA